jgi:hypothetical protein
MSALRENAITLLGSAVCDVQNGDGKTTVFTVPTGKSCIVTHMVVRNPSGSLAGGTDFDFGDGANADTWKTTVDLSSMTAITDYMLLTVTDAKITIFDAGDAIGVKPATGATADVTATVEIFGYLY